MELRLARIMCTAKSMVRRTSIFVLLLGKDISIDPHGQTFELTYCQDEKIHELIRLSDGSTNEYHYQNGVLHGRVKFLNLKLGKSIWSNSSGACKETEYVKGQIWGIQKVVNSKGIIIETEYEDGFPMGREVELRPDGFRRETHWNKYVKSGKETISRPDGYRLEVDFENGVIHGKFRVPTYLFHEV